MRSYRADEWNTWFAHARIEPWTVNGPVFDSSRLMVEAAVQGAGVALAPPRMFVRELQSGVLMCPFDTQVETGCYWLTWLKSRQMSSAMELFRSWIVAQAVT